MHVPCFAWLPLVLDADDSVFLQIHHDDDDDDAAFLESPFNFEAHSGIRAVGTFRMFSSSLTSLSVHLSPSAYL